MAILTAFAGVMVLAAGCGVAVGGIAVAVGSSRPMPADVALVAIGSLCGGALCLLLFRYAVISHG